MLGRRGPCPQQSLLLESLALHEAPAAHGALFRDLYTGEEGMPNFITGENLRLSEFAPGLEFFKKKVYHRL